MEQVAFYVTGHFTERQQKWLHIKPLSDPPTLIIIHQTLIVTNRSDIRWQDFLPDILIIRSWRLDWIIIWMPKQSPLSPVLGGDFKYVLFSLYLGMISKLTNIFQMGWFNHQLVFADLNSSDFGTTFSCLWDRNPLLLQSLSQNPWLITNSIRKVHLHTFTSDMTFLRQSMGIF